MTVFILADVYSARVIVQLRDHRIVYKIVVFQDVNVFSIVVLEVIQL